MFLALFSPALAGVLINEVLYDPTSSDDGLEWIELCNDGATQDLEGWTIEAGGSSWGVCYELGAGSITNGEYVLIGYGGTTWPGSFDPNLQNGGDAADGVRLVDASGTVIDTVLYDSPDTSGLGDDGGTATSFAPDAGEGKSIGRSPDCLDTDASGDDFVLYDSPSPGAANPDGGGTGGTTTTDPPGDADCTGSEAVTINEFSPATDVEFAEIYAAAAVDLSGWVFEYGTASFSKSVTLPAGTVLAAGERFTLGSAGAVCKDLEVDMDFGNATSSADGLRLTCNGQVVDTVIYGPEGDPNADGWLDDSGKPATSIAGVPESGFSMGRAPDGYDTDQAGDDFFQQENTACAPNPEPPVCTPGNRDIKLNEFLYNPVGDDAGREWVELVNTGSTDFVADGWVVEVATSEWKQGAVFPVGTVVPAGGFLVVGGPDAPGVGVASDDFSLGNGTEGDGMRLVDCEGRVMDTVLWGEPMNDGLTDDLGGSDVVPGVDENISLGRYPDGTDTDDITDWHGYITGSPGSTNADPGGTGSTDDPGKTGVFGCGNRPDSTRPAGSCSSAPVMGGWLLAAVAAARRRRR